FTPDGKALAISNDAPPYVVKIWDLASGQLRASHKLDGPPGPGPLLFRSDGKILERWLHEEDIVAINRQLSILAQRPIFSRDRDGAVSLFDLETGRALGIRGGHRAHVGAAGFSSDGRLFATGSNDGIIKVWDMPAR